MEPGTFELWANLSAAGGVITVCAAGVAILPWSDGALADTWRAWRGLPSLIGGAVWRTGRAMGRLEPMGSGRLRRS